jgi:PilZ domain
MVPQREPASLRLGAAIILNDRDAVILQQLVIDVRSASISCAYLLGALNAVEFSKGISLPLGIARHSPVQPKSFAALTDSCVAGLLSQATRSCLKGFAFYLGKAAADLADVLAVNSSNGLVLKKDVSETKDALATAACFAKVVLRDLLGIQTQLGREYEIAELSYLAVLLDEVLDGKSPLMSDGRLLPLKTDFSVREVRVELNAEAIVLQPACSHSVVVRNISRGGLGFKGAKQFEIGQPVIIRLVEIERRFQGRIVWLIGDQAGVLFSAPLSDNDPLLRRSTASRSGG